MNHNYFFMMTLVLAILILPVFAYTQGSESMVVTLSVSPQQETNFNLFMSWLDTHFSLKQNDNIKKAYQSVFAALKLNDYEKYVKEINILNHILEKMGLDEKNEIHNFFQKLAVPAVTPQIPIGGGKCSIICEFGYCVVKCPPGLYPFCICMAGFPMCRCETEQIE